LTQVLKTAKSHLFHENEQFSARKSPTTAKWDGTKCAIAERGFHVRFSFPDSREDALCLARGINATRT
jgi:hypothetical protein